MRRDWERLLQRNELASGPLSGLMPANEFVDDGVFITIDGHLGIMAQLNPQPWECLPSEDLDSITATFRRMLPRIDPEMRVYQYVRKRSRPKIDMAEGVRLKFLKSRLPEMYSVDFYLAVVYEVKKEVKLKARTQSAEGGLDRAIAIEAHRLRDCVEGFLAGIKDYVGSRILDRKEVFAFHRKLVNYSPLADRKQLARNWDLAWQIADSNVEVDPVLRVGREYLRVFTLKELSESTEANHLWDLLELPVDAWIVTEWRRKERADTRKEIKGAKAKLTYSEVDLVANARLKPVPEQNLVIDQGKRAEREELGDVEKVLRKNVSFGKFSLTVIIHDEDPYSLGRAAAKVEECLLLSSGAMVEQTGFSSLFAWLSTVPGNIRFSKWAQRISNENYADMSFLFGPPSGEVRDKYLNAEALTLLEARVGTQYHLALHPKGSENGNTVVTGAPRSGKSFLNCHVVERHQETYGGYTIIFDNTPGYRILTERLGGEYVKIGTYDSPAKINPFCLEGTPDNIDFIARLLRHMLEANESPALVDEDFDVLKSQVGELYGLSEGRRRLGSLALPQALSRRLSPWRLGGAFAFAFDNPVDTLSFGTGVTTFEFPDQRKSTEVVDAIMYYALCRCDREVARRKPQPGLFVFDEGWKFLKREDSKNFLVDSVKGFPKCGASVLLATHSVSDMSDASVRSVVECCVNQWHFSNPGIDEKQWQDYFGLSSAETNIIRTDLPSAAGGFSEFLVKGAGVVRLFVDPMSVASFSNSAHSNAKRERLIAEHGANGLEIFARETV